MRKPIIWITSIAGAAVLIGGGTAIAFATGSIPNAPSPSATLSDDDSSRSATASPSASAVPDDLEGAIAAALAEVGPGTVIDADTDDNAAYAYEIDIRLDAGGVVEVKLDSSLDVVSTGADDDSGDDSADDSRGDDAVPDAAAVDKASAAALAHVGSGTVTSVELSDDSDHVYEVEIDLGDGEDVDVELDAQFAVVKAD